MIDKHLKIFVYTPLTMENKQFLLDRVPKNIDVVFSDELDDQNRADQFAGSAFLYGNPPVGWLEEKSVQLQWMQLNSVGFEPYQHLSLAIPISNMHGYFAQPCAETLVAGVMALYRKIDELVTLKNKREWAGGKLRSQMRLLKDRKVIILGTGTIAMAIKEILAGFRCQITFYGRSHPEVGLRGKEELIRFLPETDILINTLPNTTETNKFVSEDLLKVMNPEAIFANIGRGSTVDESALASVLQRRGIGGAVLDVFEEEPLPPDSPLWTCPNTILTQHTGGGTVQEEEGKILFFIENLDCVLKGKPPLNVVDLKKGY